MFSIREIKFNIPVELLENLKPSDLMPILVTYGLDPRTRVVDWNEVSREGGELLLEVLYDEDLLEEGDCD